MFANPPGDGKSAPLASCWLPRNKGHMAGTKNPETTTVWSTHSAALHYKGTTLKPVTVLKFCCWNVSVMKCSDTLVLVSKCLRSKTFLGFKVSVSPCKSTNIACNNNQCIRVCQILMREIASCHSNGRDRPHLHCYTDQSIVFATWRLTEYDSLRLHQHEMSALCFYDDTHRFIFHNIPPF